MKMNKDEALRCVELAEEYVACGDLEKAERFLLKAEKLYETDAAKGLLQRVITMKENPEYRKPPSGSGKENSTAKDRPKSKERAVEYTQEQLVLVKKISGCKDYYDILNVSKEATDSDIKKSYKKLALQLHPDKNKAPGASEAFKAVGNAVAILTDVEKRKKYDLYGANEEKLSHRHHSNYQAYTRGFEADVSAEELFNMFFGTGFTTAHHHSNIFMRRAARRQAQEEVPENHNSSAIFIQLLPIILLFILSALSSFLTSEPVFSLTPSSKYPIARHTARWNVPYYVKETFRTDYEGSLIRLENTVEDEYLNNLRNGCYREKSSRDHYMWRARTLGDETMYNRAKEMTMPACEEYARRISTKP